MSDDDDLRSTVCEVLGAIAPEADLDSLDPEARLQDELDLDSLNFLDFVTGLHQRTGVDIPERDYPKIGTLADCVSYLRLHLVH
jgi:acyl carrier protein